MADASGLNVVIDGRELVGRPTGVGRYVMGLLTEWARGTSRNRFTVIVPGAVPAELAALSPRIEVATLPAGSTGTWFEQTALPSMARTLKADVFFAPAYTAPLRLSCPFVVVIHDLSYFAHPEWFGWREGLRRRWLTRETAKRAASIITVSQFSKAEIQRYLGTRPDRVEIAGAGAPIAGAGAPIAGAGAPTAGAGAPPDRVAEAPPAGSRPRLVLYAGSIFTRRGVPSLIEAFADVVRQLPDARLVIVGENRATPPVDPTQLAAANGIASHVDWRRYVSDAELDALYGQARVFAFLSDYEGYAMTPMEAIARGVPVVLRDTAISREIYADGAVCVGYDRAALAAALTRLLTDEGAHADVLSRGRKRLGAFSWATSAATVLGALERAAVRQS